MNQPIAGSAAPQPSALGAPTPELRELIAEMRARGWSIYQWSHRQGDPPHIVAAVYLWDDGAGDVVIMRTQFMAGAYRAMPCDDVFEPTAVTLWDWRKPEKAFREVLDWEPYGQEERPREPIRPMPGLGLARRSRMRMAQRIDLPNSPVPIETEPIFTA